MQSIVGLVRDLAGGDAPAIVWYRNQPIPPLGGQTAEALINAGETGAVHDWLEHLAHGSFQDGGNDRCRRIMPFGIGAGQGRQHYQRLPQRPAGSAGDGGVVQTERGVKCGASWRIEKCPANGEIAGRVTDGAAAEIDHRRQPATADQQIARRDIAMHPDNRVRPAAGQSSFP